MKHPVRVFQINPGDIYFDTFKAMFRVSNIKVGDAHEDLYELTYIYDGTLMIETWKGRLIFAYD